MTHTIIPFSLLCICTSICLISRNEDIVPHIIDWRDLSGGIFGLGTTKWKTSMISILDALQIQSFALDLNHKKPHVDINRFSSIRTVFLLCVGQYADSIIWSNRMTPSSRHITSYYFHIYDFSLCDVSLFGSFTSHYPAVISPASRCLTVPMQIFNNIAGWLPIECPYSSTVGGQRLCYLSSVRSCGRYSIDVEY